MTAGITGHQNLGTPETVEWVTQTLISEIEKRGVKHGFTSLAIGADQIFARILYEKKIPYTAVVPCQNYEDTFNNQRDLAGYRELLHNANEIIQLKFNQPEESAFLEAGKQVVQLSEFLFAVWNGLPAKGLGGTADIVNYARAKQIRVVHLNPVNKQLIGEY